MSICAKNVAQDPWTERGPKPFRKPEPRKSTQECDQSNNTCHLMMKNPNPVATKPKSHFRVSLTGNYSRGHKKRINYGSYVRGKLLIKGGYLDDSEYVIGHLYGHDR